MVKMENSKILLVDDEEDILDILQYNLRKEGYQTVTASNGKKAISKALKEKPDMVILDVMMPDMDGIETCQQLRDIPALQDTLIVFLSARGEDYSQIAGYEAGADDYITKPIRPKVLLSKVKALMKRQGSRSESPNVIEVNGIGVDRDKYVMLKEGEEFSLPKKEFELLSLLMSVPGKVFTREVILNSIWGDEVVVGDRTIDVHIRKIREKVGEKLITTVKGVGYKFEES